jgi:hypothetical protein
VGKAFGSFSTRVSALVSLAVNSFFVRSKQIEVAEILTLFFKES